MSMLFHRWTIALLALLGVAACAPRPVSHTTMGPLSSSGGPIDSPILGEFVKYRSTLEGARTRARADLVKAGYTLTDEQERTMMFTRQLGRSALTLSVRFTPS